MGTISEALELQDRVTSPANKMAAAVGRVAAAMDRYKASAKGAERQKAFAGVIKEASALRKLEDARAKERASSDAKARKAIEQKRAKEAAAFKASGAAHARGEQGDKKALAATSAIAAGIVAVGAAAIATAIKVGEITASLVEAVGEAHATREAVTGMLKQLGATNAPKALEALDRLSLKLGLSLEEGRKQFVDLGKAGKTASEAAGIIKMRADLIAVGNSAEMADEKLKPVLEAKGAGATAAALAKVGKEAGVAGDGVAAANKRLTTFEGFVTRLKNAPARIFDQLAKSAGPSLDKLGEKANKALDELLRSPEAAAAVGMVTQGLTKVIDVVSELMPLVMPFVKGFAEGVKPIAKALGPVADAISKAFGGDNQSKMSTAEKIGKLIGTAFSIAAVAIGVVAGVVGVVAASFVACGIVAAGLGAAIGKLIGWAIVLVSDFPSLVGSAMNRAKAYMMLLADSAGETANNLIQGLVDGISGGAGRVITAVKELGASVKSALSSALQIKSPSKVMQKLGGHISGGLAKGISGGQGMVEKASAGLGNVSAGGVAAGATGGGGGNATVNINVTAAPGATQADGEALALGMLPIIRREVTSIMRGRAAEFG